MADFKVGDRVKVVRDTSRKGYSITKPGYVGTITSVQSDIHSDRDMEIDNLTVKSSDLEHVEGKPAKQAIMDRYEDLMKPSELYATTMGKWTDIGVAGDLDNGFIRWIDDSVSTKQTTAKKPMAKLTTLAKKLLDADTRALVKAGILDSELEIADDQFVLSFIVEKFKEELAKEARAKIRADKKESDE